MGLPVDASQGLAHHVKVALIIANHAVRGLGVFVPELARPQVQAVTVEPGHKGIGAHQDAQLTQAGMAWESSLVQPTT